MEFFETIFNLGFSLYKKKQINLAKICFKISILDKSIRSESLLNLTYLYQYSRKYKKAIKLLKSELKNNYNKDLEYQLGFFYALNKDFQKSKFIFEKLLNNYILKKEKIDQQIIISLIDTYNELKEYDEVIKLFNFYKNNINKNDPDKNNCDLYYNLGLTFLNNNNYNIALEYFNEALKYSDEDKAKTTRNIALCYYKRNDYDKAIEYYNKALKFNDEEIFKTYHNIGECYFEKKDYDKAYYYYNEALKNTKTKIDKGEEEHSIACVYEKIGDVEKAKQYLKNAIKHGFKKLE